MKRLILVLLSVLCLSACKGRQEVTVANASDYALPLETALHGLMAGDGEAYLEAFPPKMAEDYKLQDVYLYYYSLADMTAWLKNNLRIYGENYGKDAYVDGSLSDERTVSVDSLGDANLDYHTFMRYVTEANTEEVRAALFSYTIGGDDKKENKKATLYFVKQNGKWYLHPCFAFYTF